MTDRDLTFSALSDLQVLSLTAWAEARGDAREGASSVEERIAVMWVVKNRQTDHAARWPRTIKAVCLQPYQFSCWNPGQDANHLGLLRLAVQVLEGKTVDPLYAETEFLAGGVITGRLLDRTGRSNHYLVSTLLRSKPPQWAKNRAPIVEIGAHAFFCL